MKPETHACACCPTTIPTWHLLCPACYALLPKSIKEGLSEEYRYMKRARTRHTDRWLELRRQAVEVVKLKIEKRAARKRADGDLLAAA
jgi:hypothetical protein